MSEEIQPKYLSLGLLQPELCCPADCSIDIAVGFDISRRRAAPSEVLTSGQTKLQAFLPEIAQYLSVVPRLCCTNTPVSTNMAYRLVNRNGRVLYDFNFEGYSEDVLKKVMSLNLSEPTYFNTAMLRSFQEKFQSESRAGVKVSLFLADMQLMKRSFIRMMSS